MTETFSTGRKITLAETSDFLITEDEGGGAAQRRFGLLIFCDGEAQLRLLGDGASVVVGRQPPSEVVVDDPSVSRQHARFSRNGDEVWVEDLDSRNGTFRQGQRIQRERIDASSEIEIGRARVVLAATRSPMRSDLPASSASEFVLCNARMRRLYEDAARAARANVPVLVLGETGVGKEHVARAIHAQSDRRDGPFVVINCATIPASLLESTLFGHERGAFTGATGRAIGVFERAQGGVLFLDEIGDLGVGAQAALLRAIETRRILRVGASVELPINVRIVAATHCDLEAMVEEETFRQDLFYRLNAVTLDVPPLRERRDEIEPLVQLFLAHASRDWGVPARQITPESMELARSADWPGNIRQLRNAVERAALLATGEQIGLADWPEQVASASTLATGRTRWQAPAGQLALREHLRHYERALIEEALRRAGGNRQMAAKLLRIPLRTLFRKIRAVAIEPDDRHSSE